MGSHSNAARVPVVEQRRLLRSLEGAYANYERPLHCHQRSESRRDACLPVDSVEHRTAMARSSFYRFWSRPLPKSLRNLQSSGERAFTHSAALSMDPLLLRVAPGCSKLIA